VAISKVCSCAAGVAQSLIIFHRTDQSDPEQTTQLQLNLILENFTEKFPNHLNFHLDRTTLTTTLHKIINSVLNLFYIFVKKVAKN
jgi:hypothetical protein